MARRPDIEVKITGDSSQVDRVLRTLQTDVDRVGGTVLSRFGAAGNAVGALGGKMTLLAGTVAAPVAALLSLATIAKQAADAVLQIDQAAQRSAVSFEVFQQMQFAALQAQVPVDALADGLYELNLRAAEFVKTGAGPAEDAFKRLGMSPEDVKRRLEDPAAFFETIIDRVRTLDDATARLTLDEIFAGTAAERFVGLLDQVPGQFAESRQEAEKLGAVMSDDMLRTAEDINQRWETMALIVSTNVKGAVLSVVGAMLDAVNMGQQLNAQLEALAATNEGMAKSISRRAARHGINRPGTQSALQRGDGVSGFSATQQLIAHGNPLGMAGGINENVGFTPIVDEPKAKPKKSRSGGGGGSRAIKARAAARDEEAIAADRQAEAVAKLVDGLRFELEMLGKSETEQRIANELRSAGVEAASEQGQQIAALVTEIEMQTDALDAQKSQAEEAADAMKGLGDVATSWADKAIDGTLEFSDVLKFLISDLQGAMSGSGSLLGSLFGLGGGGGGFGALIGGLFAKGAAFSGGSPVPFARGGVVGGATLFPMAGGRTGVMGEAGPEAIMPLTRGRNGSLGVRVEGGGEGSSSMSYAPVYQIDARGADQAAVARIEAALDASDRSKARDVNAILDRRQTRGVVR